MSRRVMVGLAVSLGLWILGGTHARMPDVGTWLILLGLAIVVELTATRLPQGGFVSLASAIYVAAAIKTGWGPAMLLAGLAILMRTLARGGSTVPLRAQEMLIDLLGVLPPLAVMGLVHSHVGLAIYCFTAVWVASYFDPGERSPTDWGEFMPVRLGAVGLGVAATQLHPDWLVLLLVPTMLGLYLGILFLARQASPEEEMALAAELSRRQEELAVQNRELRRTRSGLIARRQEQSLFTQMARAIASARDVDTALNAVLRVAMELVRCRSVVIWLHQSGHLLAAAYISPDSERLAGAALSGVVETSVSACWHRQKPVFMQVAPPEERLQLSYPIPGFGVLYAGRDDPYDAFDQDDKQRLAMLAEHTTVALATAIRSQSFQSQLDRLSREHRRLQESVQVLEELLSASRLLATALDEEQILRQAMQTAERLLKAEAWLAVLHDRPVAFKGELGDPAACRSVAHSGKPLLVTEPATSRLPPPLRSMKSWLVVPLTFEREPLGVLVAASRRETFSRRQQDQFSLLAYQAAAALTTLSLQREVTQSSKLAAIGGLAAGIAHELNNPLGAVQLAIDLADETMDAAPGTARGSLGKASRALERSRQIVESLLVYTREQTANDSEPCRLNKLVSDVMEMLGPLIERSGVQLEVNLDANLPGVPGNSQELRQAISNLLLNARDAAESSPEPRIAISTFHEGERVFVNVSDSGTGVEPTLISRIFDPFFTTKPPGKGTGLGLAITNRVAQRHGGCVHVDRSPALGGASFTLEVRSPA